MASVKELLMISLKELGTDYLKGFQWHLKNDGRISASELESADVCDTVDKMVAHFGLEEAVKITVDILRKMNQNNLAGELENNEAQTEGSMKASFTFGADSKQTEVMASVEKLLVNSLEELEKDDLMKFKWYLKNNGHFSASEMENADVLQTVDKMVACFGPEEAVKITVEILRKMNQNRLAEELKNKHKEAQTEGSMKASFTFGADSKQTEGSTLVDRKADLHDYREISFRLKNKLQEDYKRILVGNSQTGHRQNLNDIYTDLYVVENETGGIVSEHEVRQIELNIRRFTAKDSAIQCNDIFKVHMGQQNRKVLTMGIAGVGKTLAVNKFILDWAEGKENQDILFIFPLPFHKLNMIKEEYSLIGLINKCFFSGPEDLPSLPEDNSKVMFIFDGLDECRFPLIFKKGDRFTDVHKKATVSKIVTNLIKRQLFPSALIWITSRPAAAGLIPREHIDQVTEVRGFNDEQKEQYFHKNSSPEVAGNIIRHMRKSRSLYIMCHIPVFCWISLTVLQPLLAQESNDKTPTTLTEMYTNFLLSQKQQMKTKYCDNPELNPEAESFEQILLKLGELAFKQLQKGNLIFYKEDLEECGLDVSEGSVYSGLCTQIFQKEKISVRKVYSFVHRSVQEFLAALCVFEKHTCSGKNPFLKSQTWKRSKTSLFELHKSAIDEALKSEYGHLDLFLRFLLGLSLESNQSDLKELLPGLELKTKNVKDTVDYIKKKIEMEKSVERTINLFHCLDELKDDFVKEIENNQRLWNLSAQNLSSAQWSALVFVLLMSEETQEKFELQKYRRSDEALMRLLPVIKKTRRALLQCRDLTFQCCNSLSSALQSCVLRELNLSNNDIRDSGVMLLSDGLKSPNCQLEILSLAVCNLTAQCCRYLASALQSCVLRELNLSNNDLQDSGMKLLSDGLKSPNCQLHILRLSGCMVTDEGCGYVSSALSSNPLHLKELDLSYNHPRDSGVKLLSDKLKDPNCSLHILNVDCGGDSDFRSKVAPQKYARDLTLNPNTAHTQLILSEENKTVTRVFDRQSYPDHPERFDIPQVLCGESLTGRCYWEAEWSGDSAEISMTYKGIRRKGDRDDCWFGSNDKSWSLDCYNNRFTVRHNNNETHIPAIPSSSKRVGVYVNVSAGTLSFYSVSDTHTLTHLHTINTTFTKPLYAGFRLYEFNSSVFLWDVKQPPVRTNRDTQTARFSEPNPSGLNIHPLLNCQSCVHIADSDQRVQIKPSACTDEEGSKFRVKMVKKHWENDLQNTPTREEDQTSVSTATTEKDELHLRSEADKTQFFDDNWSKLIQKVTNIGIIADKLLQQKIIQDEQYSKIRHQTTSQDSMREICDIIRKHSKTVKAEFISILQKEERYLLEHWFDSTP